MRQLLAVVSVIGALGALVKYFQSSGNEYVLRLRAEDIRRRLQEKLPWHSSDSTDPGLVLDKPRVRLIEGSDEVVVGLDLALALPAVNRTATAADARELYGAVEFAAQVEYCAREAAFYLCVANIHHCNVPLLPEGSASAVHTAIAVEIDKLCDSVPIHCFARDGGNLVGENPGSHYGEGTAYQSYRSLRLSDVAVVDRNLMIALD